MRDRRVVVTGLGAVTPIGNDVSTYWESIKQGQNGIGLISKFDTEGYKIRIAAELKGFDADEVLGPKAARRMDPFTQYGMAASHEAIKDSGLDFESEDTSRVGTILSSGIGGMIVYHNEHTKLIKRGPGSVSPFFVPMMIPDILPGYLSIHYGLTGPNYSTISACASGSHAIGNAFMHIERGDADVMIAGGAECVITEMAVAGFTNMRALSCRNDDPEHASRPFDKERDGFVMGEGSGVVVLEELSHALKRGAEIYAEMGGIGFTGDGHHITAPHPEGKGAAKAMELAVNDAGVNLDDVDYINAHGTSTPFNDRTETFAIKSLFGHHARKLCVSSTKSMVGHLLGASGAVEYVASTLALKHSIIPPTINYTVPDPDCDLDYVPNTARDLPVNVVISNSFGFGGHNVCLCLKKYQG
ncbi:beta-ketoacyl-[acyl-carrier-protein] synthase II [bacterium I07]|nr:beta-ketoacyl-[acyl-carrier-protein] synthase II [bacterium I07]